jgi:MerR family transcriptional regulator, light-induced transcriptional regulator
MSTDNATHHPALRIGQLSRRVGISAGTLRAWERRYGIPNPVRTESGYRLYSREDEARVLRLNRLREEGLATAEAARLAGAEPLSAGETGLGRAPAGPAASSQAGASYSGPVVTREWGAGASAPAPLRAPVQRERIEQLAAALSGFDEREANAVLDAALAELSFGTFVEGLVLPFLEELGRKWKRCEVTVADEHFATNLVRGRLLGLARSWGSGGGPGALLACPPNERHDLGLICFGLLLGERGWRITFFGQDTPLDALASAAESLAPSAVVVSSIEARRLRTAAERLEAIAHKWDLYLGGTGVTAEFADAVGAIALPGEPGRAAELIAERAEARVAA